MKIFRIIIIASGLLLFNGCENESYNFSGVYPPYVPSGTPVILFQDSATLSGIPKDEAKIVGVSLVRDVLSLTMRTSGGCRQHVYTLYGDIRFMESKPVRGNIYLSHNANNDPCDAIMQTTAHFNLTPLKRSYLAQYRDNGPILLRIHEPGKSEPLEFFVVYRF